MGVRIFNRSTVLEASNRYAGARDALLAWYSEVEKAAWNGPADVKSRYPQADIVGTNRLVFNIKGNNYRIIVAVKYEAKCVFIRFIGTHAEYDKVDAATV